MAECQEKLNLQLVHHLRTLLRALRRQKASDLGRRVCASVKESLSVRKLKVSTAEFLIARDDCNEFAKNSVFVRVKCIDLQEYSVGLVYFHFHFLLILAK